MMIGALVGSGLFAEPAPAGQSRSLGESLRAAVGPVLRESTAGRYHLTAGPAGAIEQARVERLVSALADFEQAYRAMWQGQPSLRETTTRVELYLIVEGGRLRQVMKSAGIARPFFEAGGVYLKESATLIIENASQLERSILASLVHETTHFLNHEILQGDAFPPWLNEGLAQYCEYSRYEGENTGARYHLGEIDPGSELRVPEGDGETIYQFTPARSLSYLQGQLMRDRSLSLGPLLKTGGGARFYGEGSQLRYAQSWTLVHLLAEGSIRGGGSLRVPFLRYVAMAARGDAMAANSLPKALGMTIEDLDDAWRRHLKRLQ